MGQVRCWVRAAVTAVGVVLVAAGCSGGSEAEEADAAEDAASPEPSVAAEPSVPPEPVEWGEPVTVAGSGGTAVELTPVGVRYIRYTGLEGAAAEEAGAPADGLAEGYFVAVAVEAVAAEGQERIADDGMLWTQEGEDHAEGGANAVIVPWEGEVPDLAGITVTSEEPALGIATFDLPEKGGELVYVDSTGARARWTALEDSGGQGLEGVDATLAGE